MSGDEVKADTMLRGVTTTNPPLTRLYRQSLVRPFAYMYTLLSTDKPYILSCFLALLIVGGRPDCLETWCGDSVCLLVTMRLGSTCIVSCPNANVSFLLLFLSLMDPLAPMMISPERCIILCHPSSVHLHLPCDPVSFPFVILERYNAPNYVMSQAWGHARLSWRARRVDLVKVWL